MERLLTITHSLEIVLHRNGALLRQSLDFGLSVGLPVVDVLVVSDTQRSSSEDDRADVVIKARCSNSLLVRFWRAGLLRQDESCADPDSRGAEHQRCSQTLAIVQTSGSNDLNRLSAHGRLVAFDELGNGWDKERRWDVASVATTFATLGANQINTELEALLHVLWMANH